jgi:hypothetical protein
MRTLENSKQTRPKGRVEKAKIIQGIKPNGVAKD